MDVYAFASIILIIVIMVYVISSIMETPHFFLCFNISFFILACIFF